MLDKFSHDKLYLKTVAGYCLVIKMDEGGEIMEFTKKVNDWKDSITFVLHSKQSEFYQLGYKHVTKDEIWHCLYDKIWKGNVDKRLHEIVQDILHLKASTYMTYVTISSMQSNENDLHASIKEIMDTPKETE